MLIAIPSQMNFDITDLSDALGSITSDFQKAYTTVATGGATVPGIGPGGQTLVGGRNPQSGTGYVAPGSVSTSLFGTTGGLTTIILIALVAIVVIMLIRK